MLDHFGTELSEVAARACGRAKQSTGISIRSASPRAELPWVAAFRQQAKSIRAAHGGRKRLAHSAGSLPAVTFLEEMATASSVGDASDPERAGSAYLRDQGRLCARNRSSETSLPDSTAVRTRTVKLVRSSETTHRLTELL